jgi:integrase
MITVTSATGRQIRRKRVARTYAEARTRLKQLQDDKRRGMTSSKRHTISSYLDDWVIRQVATGKKSPATISNYHWAIDKHIKPAIGPIGLDKLIPEDVDRLLNTMATSGAAGNTMMRVRAVLCMALSDAVRRRAIAWNAASATSTPDGPKRTSRTMTVDEVNALLGAAEHDRLKAMWVTGVMLGLRPGELSGLTWADIDLDVKVIHVRRSRLHRPSGVELGETKTPHSLRSVEMPSRVADALHTHKVAQAQERLASTHWTDWDLAFADEGGVPLTRWRLATLLNDLTKRAGIGQWQPRELRHTAISLMFHADIPREVIADVVGHAPGSTMTAGTYRHPVVPSISGAKVAMDAIFQGESKAV